MQMKIKYLHALTADENDFVCEYRLNFCQNKSIHVICGKQSDTMLSFLASLSGDYNAFPIHPTAVLHSEVILNGNEYRLCVLHEEDEVRLSVNFDSEKFLYNSKDTMQYLRRIRRLSREANTLFFSRQLNTPTCSCGESTRILFAFENFLSKLEEQKEGKKPLYIVDLLDCLDESIDLVPLFNRLSALHRQVFLTCRTPKYFLHPDADLING